MSRRRIRRKRLMPELAPGESLPEVSISHNGVEPFDYAYLVKLRRDHPRDMAKLEAMMRDFNAARATRQRKEWNDVDDLEWP